MKQALHIFRKDIRYLRFEIMGLLALTAAFAALPPRSWAAEILEVAALYVIARLTLAEPIPGDRQFWLTRPYNPTSLFMAKLFFILLFICVPIAVAQGVQVVVLGFPLAYELPGLLWTQVLIFFLAVLPVMALAAVTEGFVQFIATVLALVVVTYLMGAGFSTLLPRRFSAVPGGVEWMASAVFGLAMSCLAAILLHWQYRDRRTLFSRVFGVVGLYLAMALFLGMPISLPLLVETWFSKEPALASGVRVLADLNLRKEPAIWDKTRFKAKTFSVVRIPVPIVVSGLPPGVESRPDDLSISFVLPDRTWAPSVKPGSNTRQTGGGQAVSEASVEMDPKEFAAMRQIPLTIRGSIYLTLFGEAERRKISLKQGPTNVQDGLQCYAAEFAGEVDQTLCRSFFRWPSRLVYAEGNGDQTDFTNTLISYSPFPAGLNLEPLEIRWAEAIKADEATIVTKKPLVHFRRDFELRGIRLADFEKKPQAPPPRQAAR